MTSITVTYAPEALSLSARGHATGSKEACAGVSALLYALEGWVKAQRLPLRQGELSAKLTEGIESDNPSASFGGTSRYAPLLPEKHAPGMFFRAGKSPYTEEAPEARVTRGAADFRLPRTPETEAAFDLAVTGLARIAATVPEAVRVAWAEAASSRETLNPAATDTDRHSAKERRST